MNLASQAEKAKINNNMMMTMPIIIIIMMISTGIKWTLNQLKNLNNFPLYILSIYL